MRFTKASLPRLTGLAFAGIAAVGSIAGATHAQFAPATPFPAGVGPAFVARGDLNGDGKLDFAVADTNSVSILLCTGPGTFGAGQTLVVNFPGAVALADFNGDGKLDLAATSVHTDKVFVFAGTGTGTFISSTGFAVGFEPEGCAVGDLNGDGKLDVVTANTHSGDVSVLFGDGTGAFAPKVDFAAGNFPNTVAIADVTGDGKPDLLIGSAESTGGFVGVLAGTGTGGFGPLTQCMLGSTTFFPKTLAVADLNGDGTLDVAAASPNAPLTEQEIAIVFGTGAGAFGPPTSSTKTSGQWVDVGDLNGDGKLDLVSLQAEPFTLMNGNVIVRLGYGAGNFGGPTSFPVGNDPKFVGLADLNADGRVDAYVANRQSNVLSVLLGTGAGSNYSTQPTSAVGVGPRTVALADFNFDGLPDLVVTNEGLLFSPGSTVSVRLGGGKGDFPTGSLHSPSGGTSPQGVAIGKLLTGSNNLYAVVANSGSNNVAVLISMSSGMFALVTTLPTGASPSWVALGDLNNDGKPDLVVTNRGGSDVTVRLGNGGAGFGADSTFAVGQNPTCVALGDLNNDGKLDFVTANGGELSITRRLGTGTGSFGTAVSYFVGEGIGSPNSVALGDLNGDGRLDAVTANGFSPTASVCLGFGAGALGSQTLYPTGPLPFAIALGDVDKDGNLDAVIANSQSPSLSLHLGTGTGALGPQTAIPIGGSPRGVTLGDVNGDGRLDIVSADDSTSSVTCLLGSGTGSFGTLKRYGSSTPGCAGTLELDANSLPFVGSSLLKLTCTGLLPSTASLLLIGDGSDIAGTPFLGFNLHVTITPLLNAFDLPAGAPGVGVAPLPIPNVPAFVGAVLYAQAISLDPCAPTTLTASQGLRIQLCK